MGTILAQTIVDDAEKTLLDDTNDRWAADELLGYLNDGQSHIVIVKHDAYVKNTAVQLAAGTKQSLPADGVWFQRLTRNMGTGAVIGKAISMGNMGQLDLANPDWHTDTANAVVDEYMLIDEDPKAFYVSPPQPASGMGWVDLVYTADPADVAIGVAITLDDIYKDALYLYVLSRAYAKDSAESSAAKSGSYYNTFLQTLGLKSQAEASK